LITKTKFKVHIFFYFVGLICFLTGNFKNFIIFTSIIIIHELGHIIGALICNWNIDRIILLPFGGITIFKEHLNKPLKEELLITLLGPLFQIVFCLIFKNNSTVSYFNFAILFFNLLPIYPLDGSKLVNIFCNKISSFKLSHKITVFISIISLIILIILKNNSLLIVLILLFLLIEIIKEINKHSYYFNKFLLERYLYNFDFSKRKVIKNVNKMMKDTKHVFYIDEKYYTEKDFIRKMFDNQKVL